MASSASANDSSRSLGQYLLGRTANSLSAIVGATSAPRIALHDCVVLDRQQPGTAGDQVYPTAVLDLYLVDRDSLAVESRDEFLDLERPGGRCDRHLQGQHHVVIDAERQRTAHLGRDQLRGGVDAGTLPGIRCLRQPSDVEGYGRRRFAARCSHAPEVPRWKPFA